ncbi:hypothetical protein BCR42DRAFT_434325 [Absidia repens]|uniref:Uncharacterized protein n=1 Tax=Absidia repens TaxID=90262 RepID=A0A1X2ISA9_9FUNG|nr:hypothetical protein BCR42DRAFT_434325 [Absidia repens]
MAQKWSGSRMSQMITSTKRVVPSQSYATLDHHHDIKTIPISKPKFSLLPKAKDNSPLERDSKSNFTALLAKSKSTHHHDSYQGPSVYYNGSIDTLDEFSEDRLAWLLQPSTVEDHLSQWASPHSVALRKPNVIDHSSYKITSNPMAMLYLRVFDVVKSTSAKASSFHCKVQIHDQIYNGVPTPCVKYEKQSSQAEIDEVYLL